MSSRAIRVAAAAVVTAAVVLVLAWLATSSGPADVRFASLPDSGSPPGGELGAGSIASTRAPEIENEAAARARTREAVAAAPERAMPPPSVLHVGPLRTKASFHAVVLDGESGAPIQGAYVHGAVTGASPAVTDELGRFATDVATGGTTLLSIDAEGYASTSFPAGPAFDDPSRAAEVRLWRPAALEVRVVDGGEPLAGAGVTLRERQEPIGPGSSPQHVDAVFEEFHARTDAEGRARFDPAPAWRPLAIRIRPSYRGVLVLEPALQPGEQREVTVDLATSATLRGRLRDREGRGIAGHAVLRTPATEAVATLPASTREAIRIRGSPDAYVLAHSSTPREPPVLTDSSGRFEMREMTLGLWNVGPARDLPDGSLAPFIGFASLVEIRPGATTVDLELVVDHSLFLRGRVATDRGDPPPCRIEAWSADPGVWAAMASPSASDGTFEIGPMPEGRWHVQARTLPDPGNPISSWQESSEPVVVEAGTDGIVLELAASSPLCAALIDRRSNQRRAGEIAIVARGSKAAVFRLALVDGLDVEVHDGEWILLGRTADGFFGRAAIGAASRELREIDVELAPGARLALSNDSDARVAFVVLDGDVPIASRALTPGEGEVIVVPPGVLRIDWRDAAGGAATDWATLSAGQERGVVWRP